MTDIAPADRTLPLVGIDTPFVQTVTSITDGGLGIVGICDSAHRLVGVVTDGDLRRNFGRDLSGASAGDVMSRNPVTVSPDQLAAEALGILNAKMIQAVFVVDDDGQPVGVLHLHDFLALGVI